MRLLTLLSLTSLASSRLVNITIDDTYGDPRTGALPVYASDDPWKARRLGDGCTTCGAQPDGTRARNGTWHDKTTFANQSPSTVTVSFNGTNIYIYCILVNNIGLTNQDTRLSFELDGVASHPFFHPANLSSFGFLYDQLVYASETLSAGVHSVTVTNAASSGYSYGGENSGSIILFDYAVYTMEEPDEPSSRTASPSRPDSSGSTAPLSNGHSASINTGAIIGGTVGGVAVVLACFLVVLWRVMKWRRRRRTSSSVLDMPARDPDEREGFIDDYQAYSQQTRTSSYSLASSSPLRSTGLPGDYRVEHRRSLRKSVVVMEAGAEPLRALSVHELHDEVGKMRTELEMLKIASVPPQYIDRSESAPNCSLAATQFPNLSHSPLHAFLPFIPATRRCTEQPMRPSVLLLALPSVASRVINITIDDTYGDSRTGRIPQYVSNVPWKARSAGDGCAPEECSAQLDGARVQNGTWHDKMTLPTDPPATVTMTFNGTQVYVFCVLVNDIGITIQDTRLQFNLDGALADSFFHQADLTRTDYLYDQLVFHSQSLPLGEHTLEIVNTATKDQFHGSLLLFDYVIYTTEEDDPSPPTRSPPPGSVSTAVPSSPSTSGVTPQTPGSSLSGASPSTLNAGSAPSTSPLSTLESGTVSSPSGTPRAPQKPINLGAAVGGAVSGAVVVALLVFGLCHFARRRSQAAVLESIFHADGPRYEGLDPFGDQARISPFLPAASTSKGQPRSDIADTGASALRSEATESIRTSTANGDELRREMEKIRSEVEILKQAVGPPQYTAPTRAPDVST
ncbi:hypothetical protein AURDEDRAFT_130433 [Auricularia subglabra TFB-10046 SS5]|nr:hypothetical protein AURDEDRAFT_130433 [Auricularia subglabra TFB-10046 SS5]